MYSLPVEQACLGLFFPFVRNALTESNVDSNNLTSNISGTKTDIPIDIASSFAVHMRDVGIEKSIGNLQNDRVVFSTEMS